MPSVGAGEPRPGPVVPQPVLGAADSETKLMGAAPEGEPGEAWGYRQLPARSLRRSSTVSALEFGQPAEPESPDPQLVFCATRTRSGWQVVETPVDEEGKPYRGFIPNERSARITPHGGGLLVGPGSEPTRQDRR